MCGNKYRNRIMWYHWNDSVSRQPLFHCTVRDNSGYMGTCLAARKVTCLSGCFYEKPDYTRVYAHKDRGCSKLINSANNCSKQKECLSEPGLERPPVQESRDDMTKPLSLPAYASIDDDVSKHACSARVREEHGDALIQSQVSTASHY